MSYSSGRIDFVGGQPPLRGRVSHPVYRNPAHSIAARPVAALRSVALGAAKFVSYIFFWQSVSRGVRQLSDLDDAMLQDLGIARSEIVSNVYKEAEAEWARRWR